MRLLYSSFVRLNGLLKWRPFFHGRKVLYGISFLQVKSVRKFAPKFWLHLWTPVWHENRGPYISLGLGFVAFYRGY